MATAGTFLSASERKVVPGAGIELRLCRERARDQPRRESGLLYGPELSNACALAGFFHALSFFSITVASSRVPYALLATS